MSYFLTPEAEAELFPIGRYAHSLLYRVDDGTIRISAVAAHARRPQYWQQRKP